MKANLSYMLVYKRVTFSNILTDQPIDLRIISSCLCVCSICSHCIISHIGIKSVNLSPFKIIKVRIIFEQGTPLGSSCKDIM